MVFSSILFLFLFLPLSLGIYYVTPRRWRNFALLLLNLVFYGWGEPVYICIMIFSILVDYANGWIIENNRHRPKVAKGALLCSLVANLGMLLFFKYYDLIVTNLTALFPGLDFLHPLGISLPIGISFYTFQTMTYTIDVYRGDAQCPKEPGQLRHLRHPLPPADRRPHRQIQGCGRPADQPHGNIPETNSPRACRLFVVRPGQKSAAGQQHRPLCGRSTRPRIRQNLTVLGAWLGVVAFCLPDLLRLLRLFRYGHRPGADARALNSRSTSTTPTSPAVSHGVLAALAHLPQLLVPGVRLHPSGRQPPGQTEDLPQHPDRLAAHRHLAWRGLELFVLGPVLRPVPHAGKGLFAQMAGAGSRLALPRLYHLFGAHQLGFVCPG